MKRVISFVLCLCILCGSVFPVVSYAEPSAQSTVDYVSALKAISSGETINLLTNPDNSFYLWFINDYKNGIFARFSLLGISAITDCGTRPDGDKYIRTLANVLATYESENAGDLATQNKQDSLKSGISYLTDVIDIGVGIVSAFATPGTMPDITDYINHLISLLATSEKNVNDMIESLATYITVTQDYSSYQQFLTFLEKNSSGYMKAASSSMKKSVQESMKTKLELFLDQAEKSDEAYTEYLLTDGLVLDSLKLFAEDEPELLTCLNEYDKFKHNYSFFEWLSAIKTGGKYALLLGNVAFDTENMLNRLFEIMVLEELEDILSSEILRSTSNLEAITSEEAERVFLLLDYLIACHIRGEYCFYRIIAEDSRLLSWFSKSRPQAEENYTRRVKILCDTKENIHNALKIYRTESLPQTLPITTPKSFECVHMQTGRRCQLTLNPDGKLSCQYNGWSSPFAYTIEYAGSIADIARKSDYVYSFNLKDFNITSSQNVPDDLSLSEAGISFGNTFELYLPGFETRGTTVQAAKQSYQSGQSFGAAIDHLGQKIDAGGSLAANEYILLDSDNGSVFLAADGTGVNQGPYVGDDQLQQEEKVVSIDSNTQYRANIFLSNFSEQHFNEFSSQRFDVKDPDYKQLIDFIFKYNYLNHSDRISSSDERGEYEFYITVDEINRALNRFFNFTLAEEAVRNCHKDYYNGKVFYPFAMGESHPNFTVVEQMYDLGDGTYRVDFVIYSADLAYVEAGGCISDFSLYQMSISEARKADGGKITKQKTGTAVIRPYQAGTTSTYQLCSYVVYE